ncbi:hypothetical protein [Clostridium haemolyticum]|uniref:50S ribosomal protein L29 n=1 Tax=Clostridium haemolyticum NCTC 9693 TaxID=1443114 RepID=A0ABR4TAW1_CLOHA|nr:hypothetical protein [Clostridium haemolyticum]KEI14082.1 hypothetical protein Z960_p0085 [Clostridium haemolyticum NCTC 9693]
MDISNLSYKEFLSLSAKEQQSILSELENSNNKYNEFKNAKNLAEMREIKTNRIQYLRNLIQVVLVS